MSLYLNWHFFPSIFVCISPDSLNLLQVLLSAADNLLLRLSAEIQQVEGIRGEEAILADHAGGAAAAALGNPCGLQELLQSLREHCEGRTGLGRAGAVGEIQTAGELAVPFENALASPHCFRAHGGAVLRSWVRCLLFTARLSRIAVFDSRFRAFSFGAITRLANIQVLQYSFLWHFN